MKSVSVRRSGRRKEEGRKEGAEVASKNKNPTLRMWGIIGLVMIIIIIQKIIRRGLVPQGV